MECDSMKLSQRAEVVNAVFCLNRNPTKVLIKMPQQTKTELCNEISRFTNTIKDMRKQLQQTKTKYKHRNN